MSEERDKRRRRYKRSYKKSSHERSMVLFLLLSKLCFGLGVLVLAGAVIIYGIPFPIKWLYAGGGYLVAGFILVLLSHIATFINLRKKPTRRRRI